jgi:hypothetical protein
LMSDSRWQCRRCREVVTATVPPRQCRGCNAFLPWVFVAEDPRWRTPGASTCTCRGCQRLDWIVSAVLFLIAFAVAVGFLWSAVRWFVQVAG